MDNLLQDLRQSLRSLAARPGFTAVAVLTLALGIGATTAIFSVVRNVLLRPLPYDAPARIVQVWNPWTNEPGSARGRSSLSPLDVADVRDAVRSFERVAAYAPPASANLTGSDRPERARVTRANADVFAVLGSTALVGRTFTADEDAPGRNDVVVLSHALWQRRFGGDPDVLGRSLELDGVVHRVVGVMPPSFRLPGDYLTADAADVWKPLGLDPANLDRGNHWLHALARLRLGATLEVANTELAVLTQRWIEEGFKIRDLPAYYAAGMEDELFGGVRRGLFVLLGAVAFVLLIACVNVANLLLARADERRTEMAVRTALGAARRRILVQLLTESLVLALVGASVGVLIAWSGVQLLVALEPANLPRVGEVGIDAATLGFTAAVAVVTALLFGLVPALQASRPELVSQLRASSRTTVGGRAGQRFRGALTIGEVALSAVLLIGAALMVRTFVELSRVDLGFDPDGVLVFDIALPAGAYAPEDRIRFHTALTESLTSLPGVSAAGAALTLPLAGRLGGGSIEIEGAAPRRPGEGPPNARWQVVTPGYFAAIGYGRVDGRLLEAADRSGTAPVVVVNQTMADMLWPSQSAIGRRVRNTNSDVPWFTIVGVVRDVRHSGVIDTPSPTMYIALEQVPLTRTFAPTAMSFAVKAGAAPLAFAGAVRETVRALDPNLPVANIRPMGDVVVDALAHWRFTMLLLAIFATVAFGLAVIGIYGLLSHSVTRQWREIGIRVALGAPTASVLALVVWKGMRFALVGLAAGVVGALFLTRLLATLLYGVQPLDAITFVLVPLSFAAVALAATWLPARRAAAVDPMVALRHE